ncbi:glycosyltransferase family 61 protein [Candidatus Jidaibacter acanthamoebae]|nr:glycosyltransferase family 61 protein [Candidatus Jidaibacter acanthamoeba]
MQRFAIFLSIILITAASFYFFQDKRKLSLPLKTTTLEEYKEKYPKNVMYIDFNTSDPKEFIVILNNGYVFEDGRVITEGSEILEDVAVLKYGGAIKDNPLLKKKGFPEPKKVGSTLAVIASNGEENYYHWVFHVLPRIKLLQESKIPFDKIYIYNIKYRYQKESIRLLGIDEDKIYIGKENQFIQAEKLLVPSIAVKPAIGKLFPKWVISFLNEKFLINDKNKQFPEKVFVSRSKAFSRRIINEDELFKILEPKGYKKVFLEDLHVREQAVIFHHAKEIVAAHGSGLSNLVFCKPGTKIVEINPFDGHRGPYKMLAGQMELSYEDVDTTTNGLTPHQVEEDDIFVDIEKVKEVL